MREIKFRVWCANKKEWEKDSIYLSQHGNIIHDLRHGRSMICRPQTHIVQFYTGLRDKRGKEIWEGDWVRAKMREPLNSAEPIDNCFEYGTIRWDAEKGGWEIAWSEYDTDWLFAIQEVEVIGNIYENPDLLLEQKP